MSRGPVREAIRVLENSGLAVRVPRQGSYVAPLDPVDFEEVFTLRLALEELALRRAIARNIEELTFRVERALAEMERALEAGHSKDILEPDLDFHASIVRSADHARLLRTWDDLGDSIRRMIVQSGVLGGDVPSKLAFESVAEHRAICLGIRRGDVEAAVAALRENLDVEPMLRMSAGEPSPLTRLSGEPGTGVTTDG